MNKVEPDISTITQEPNKDLPPPPPSYDATNDASSWTKVKTMSETDALEALSDYIDENCCWGRGPMKGLLLTFLPFFRLSN